jgi:glycosyltransferase involved in cell wall biosynthesis
LVLRIIELCPEFLPCPPRKGGAIERYVNGISKAMEKLGAEIHLITIEKRRDIDYGGVHVHVIDLPQSIIYNFRKLYSALLPVSDLSNGDIPYLTMKLLRLFDKIRESYDEIDVIHSHYFTTSFAPLLYKITRNKNVTIVGHLHNEPKRNRVNKKLIEAYNAHLAVSNYVKKRTIELLKVNPGKIGIVYNAIDTDFFKPCKSSEKIDKRKKFGVEDNDFVIIFVGRIVPEKGLHHLILASKILKQKGYKFKLLVAGPLGHFDIEKLEGYPKFCFESMNKLGLSKTIKYIGHLDKKTTKDLYCVSDLVVVPSIGPEACPTVVLEAMAMGRPVVAYPSGGIPELIPPYGGIIVKEKSPRLLAESIEMAMQGVYSFNESATVEWVKERFSYMVVAQRLLKIFERMRS